LCCGAQLQFARVRHCCDCCHFVVILSVCVVCLCDEGLCRHDVSSGMKLNVDNVFRSLQAYFLIQQQAVSKHMFVSTLGPIGHYMYRQFNIQQFYVLPTQCVCVFYVDLRTNSD
jgi:hypothetical protein